MGRPDLAVAALIAGGLHGIDHGLEELEPVLEGNAYVSAKPRVPASLAEAAQLFGRHARGRSEGIRRRRRRPLCFGR